MERGELEREIERLHDQSWGWALACCARDREAAADALQSAYLRILSGRARFDGRSSIRTWLFGVIRLTALDEARQTIRRDSRTTGSAAAELVADPAPGTDALAEQSDESAALLATLGELSPRQREALELVFYHGLTIEEAAQVMHISLGSARTHYDRGKKALASKIAHGAAR